MNINEEVKNAVKEFLSKIMPEDTFQDLVTDESLDKILETEETKKIFEDYAAPNKISNKETYKFFLPAIELGLNIGYRYGVLSFYEMIAVEANDILNEAAEEDE